VNAHSWIQSDWDDTAREAMHAVRLAIRGLAADYPFHATLLAKWRLVANRRVPTAGVTSQIEHVYLIVNPEFVLTIAADELAGVLHHELNHVLFGHLFAPLGRYPDRWARVVAEEVTVNEWVPEPLPGDPIVLARFPYLPPMEDTDTRYRRLAFEPREDLAAAGTVDDHALWELTREAGEAGRLTASMAVREAAQEVGYDVWAAIPEAQRAVIGRIHGVADGTNREALLRGGRSTVDWQGALRHLVGERLRREPRLGRPPRRFPHLAGVVPGTSRTPERPRVLAVIDTSGSIDGTTLAAMSVELDALSTGADVTVAECDFRIRAVYPFAGPLRAVRGGGGTDLRPALEPCFLHRHRADAVVYLTDGLGPAPEKAPRVPVFWCLTPDGCRPANWGRTLRMRS
jgi:predicted metal-dependent peptidase